MYCECRHKVTRNYRVYKRITLNTQTHTHIHTHTHTHMHTQRHTHLMLPFIIYAGVAGYAVTLNTSETKSFPREVKGVFTCLYIYMNIHVCIVVYVSAKHVYLQFKYRVFVWSCICRHKSGEQKG